MQPAVCATNLGTDPMKAKQQQRGQGMTEYIVIVALIAVAAIATYQFFGQTVRNQTAGMAQELSGNKSDSERSAAKDAADGATAEGVKKDLAHYNNDASH